MPSFTSLFSLAALATLTRAITVISPARNTLWDSSKSNTITWTSVSTDPTLVDIYLAHMSVQPPIYSLLYANIPTSKKSVVVTDLQLPNGVAYQINLVAHDKPEQIYAQSQQFNVTGEGVEATSTVDGYTGPTYSPTSSKDSSTKTSTAKSTLITSTTTFANGTAATATTTSSDSEETGASETSSGSEGVNTTESGSSTAVKPSSTPTPTPNAAVAIGGFAGGAPLVGLVLGVVALFV